MPANTYTTATAGVHAVESEAFFGSRRGGDSAGAGEGGIARSAVDKVLACLNGVVRGAGAVAGHDDGRLWACRLRVLVVDVACIQVFDRPWLR